MRWVIFDFLTRMSMERFASPKREFRSCFSHWLVQAKRTTGTLSFVCSRSVRSEHSKP